MVLVLGATSLAFIVTEPSARIFFAVLAVISVRVLQGVFVHYYQADLTLSEEGLNHSSWKRSIRFKDVSKIQAQTRNGAVTVEVFLKARSPRVWKSPFLIFPTMSETVPLNPYSEKSSKIAEHIFNYYLRKIDKTSKN